MNDNLKNYCSSLLFRRHLSEQNFTSSQTFAQRLRHSIIFPHTAQTFAGKFDLLYFFCSTIFALDIFVMLENDFFQVNGLPFINEEFSTPKVSPQHVDALLANGWRHFGTHFFRYNLTFHDGKICRVFPLRIRLANFSISKNKRRIIKKNQDLKVIIRPITINEEKEELFERHKFRFTHSIPFSIYDFLSFDAANVPSEALEVGVYNKEKLLAASFFDVGNTSISSIYAMFAPEENSRSLGIFTMLAEIEFAIQHGKDFYYQGYCYDEKSFYDYKKRFRALEKFDWKGNWESFTE